MSVAEESTKHWIIPASARPGHRFTGWIQVTDGTTTLAVSPAFAFGFADDGSASLENLLPLPGVPELTNPEVETLSARFMALLKAAKLDESGAVANLLDSLADGRASVVSPIDIYERVTAGPSSATLRAFAAALRGGEA